MFEETRSPLPQMWPLVKTFRLKSFREAAFSEVSVDLVVLVHRGPVGLKSSSLIDVSLVLLSPLVANWTELLLSHFVHYNKNR